MVPLNDNNPTRTVPYVTYVFIALNVLIFLYEASLGPNLEAFFRVWAVIPRALTFSFAGEPTGLPVAPPLTLITSQFLHGGLLHLGGNMLFLWIFGNNVEDKLGHIKFVLFYLTCGVLAALSQWYFNMDSLVPSLGASGAIAGVMGAYILRFPRAEITTLIPLGIFPWTVRIPAVFFLGFWFVQQTFSGLMSLEAPMDVTSGGGGIAYWAHAGGFLFGAVLGPFLGLFADRSEEVY
ncbi:MAG: rhomboid family intramembrane serine protease [Cyanobacteria bacterium P01_A01_bin.17]